MQFLCDVFHAETTIKGYINYLNIYIYVYFTGATNHCGFVFWSLRAGL